MVHQNPLILPIQPEVLMEDMSERHDERSPEESSGGQECEADLSTDISLSMNKAVPCENSLPPQILPHAPVDTNEAARDDVLSPPEDLAMKWSGYAATRMKITLHEFQHKALMALHCNRDAIIIEATGSGKSTCFQLPALMLEPGKCAILIVPTIALGWDHLKAFDNLNVISAYLGADASKQDFENLFAESIPVEKRPKVIIVTPEKLFDERMQEALARHLTGDRVSFIAIDEAHLVYEWSSFRSSFTFINKLKSLFTCPILALTATLKPQNLFNLQTDILRNPVIHKGTVNRQNVGIHIKPYILSSDKEKLWHPLSKRIQQVTDGDKSIVYCAFAADCEPLSIALAHLGLKSASYTGKKTSPTEKLAIYEKMKKGDIDVLVATKAFGVGINIPDVRHVMHVGIPENISSWVQEFGRAGRDGQQAHAHLFLCEYVDLKKLEFWTKNASNEERSTRDQDFLEVWKFIGSAFTGDCLRLFILNYFDESRVPESNTNAELCCTGCLIKESIPYQKCASNIRNVLKGISMMDSRFKTRNELVFENRIVEWLCGKDNEKIWSYFNEYELKDEPSFGVLSSVTQIQAELIVKGVLRQCLSLGFLTLGFGIIPKTQIMAKNWILTDTGSKVVEGLLHPPHELPDPIKVASMLLK